MTTPPGQEPRPGFTPRGGQPRPGARGDSRWPNDPAESGEVEDYWLAGGQPGTRRPGSRPSPSFSPAPAGNRNPAANRDRVPDAPDSSRPRPATPGPGPRDAGYRDAGYGDPGYRDPGHRDPVGRRGGYETARNPRQFRDNSTFASGSYPDDTIIRSGVLATPGLRWVGTWSLNRAVWVLLAAALLGMVGTIVAGRDPGFLIGLLTILGSVVAAFGVRRAVHKLLPLPALSYLVTTTIAGMVHERANLNDSKEYITSFLTWIGSAFFAVVLATALVVVISLARWLLSRRVASGNLSASGGAAAGRNPAGRLGAAQASGLVPPGTRSGRDVPGSRDVADPRDPYGGGARGGGARGDQRSWGDRESPDSRERRDPRGEPGSRGDTRGYRPHHFGDRDRRADMDGRDPWAAVDGQDARDAGRRADRGRAQRGDGGPWGGDTQSPRSFGDSRDSRDARDPRDSRDYRDDHRPRPGSAPRDIW